MLAPRKKIQANLLPISQSILWPRVLGWDVVILISSKRHCTGLMWSLAGHYRTKLQVSSHPHKFWLANLPTGLFSLMSRTSDALWPRHLSHLPAVSIRLSVISLGQLCCGTPTRRSDCGSWQSYNRRIETLLQLGSEDLIHKPQTVYWILAASKSWIKQTHSKIMHTQNTKCRKAEQMQQFTRPSART